MGIAVDFDRNDRRLGANFAVMMLRDRYLGTGLGTFWAIAQPLLLIGIYVFVFTYLFKSRLGIERESDFSFIIWMISGYGPWLAINEGLSSGASSVTSQIGIVKNMAFKTELIPIAATTLGLVPLLVSVAVLTGLIFMDGRAPTAAWAIMPVILVFQMLFVAGFGLMLGALNVFVRDVTFVLPSLLTVLLFLSPVFYPITIFPKAMREIVQWNPIHVIANGYRLPIVEGKVPPIEQLVYLGVISVVIFLLGLAVFRRMKPFFHSRL